jgi:hypothetical protein
MHGIETTRAGTPFFFNKPCAASGGENRNGRGFNQERYLVTREVYKQRLSAALAESRALAA